MPFDATPVTSPVIEKLRLGRALIIERGWTQGKVENHAKLCTVGGIIRQSPSAVADTFSALGYLRRVIGLVHLEDIAPWNDAPNRTEADVIAAYDRAIELAIADALEGRT